MSRSKNKRGRSHTLPIFITKLLEMLQDQTIEPVFSWTSTADSFNIKSVTKFTEEVLPKYFKHKNFSSFIRQVNMYGFRKIRHQEGQNVYMNEHFKMGGRNQLRNISRRIRQQKEQHLMVYNGRGGQRNENKEMCELKSQQKNLEQLCKQMVKQNQKLMEENQNLIRSIETGYRERQKRMEDFLLMLMNHKSQNQVIMDNSETLQICYGDYGKPEKTANIQKKSIVQSMSQNLKQSEHYLKVRSIIDSIYGPMNLPKKEVPLDVVHNLIVPVANEEGLDLQRDDDGFLSINSFMDIEQFQNQINLEQSR